MNPTPTITAPRATRRQLFELKTIRQQVSEAILHNAPTALAQCLYYKALSKNYSSHDDHLMSHYLLGNYHQQILNFDKAIELYLFYLKNKDEHSNKKQIVTIHQLLAQCYTEKKLYAKAIQQYRYALQEHPQTSIRYALNQEIGKLFFNLNQAEKAIHYLRISLQILLNSGGKKAKTPQITALHVEIAQVYAHQNKIEEAKQYVLQARAIAVKYKALEEEIQADYELAKLDFNQKKYKNAYAILKKSVQRQPINWSRRN